MSENKKDSWESRINQVAKILGKDPAEIEEILSQEPFKITQDPNRLEMISDEEITPFGDMRRMFCEENGVSLPQLRMCMKVLRGPKESSKASKMDTDIFSLNAKYGLETRIEDLGIEQLLPYYDPKKHNKVYELIDEKYGKKYGNFIAFKPNSQSIAIEETLDYIADLESGLPMENSIEVDGEPVRLYGIGNLPNEKVEEDPFFPGKPLRRGRSSVNRINWSNISIETRQFFRILLEEKFVNPEDRIEIRKVIQLTINELKEIFPEAYLTFKELKEDGDLPSLKIDLSSVSSSFSQNPFSIKRNRIK